MRFDLLALCAGTVLLTGCATPTPISENALGVQVHEQYSTLLDKCQRLGSVSVEAKGQTGAVMSAIQMADANARTAAREAVVAKGGDTLVMLNKDRMQPTFEGGIPTSRTLLKGIAFKCDL